MKKVGLLVSTLIGFTLTISAQQNWCGTDNHLHKHFENHPESVQAFIEHNVRAASGQTSGADRSDPIIIPVVVHVIHDNGVGNISFEQIQSGIDMLNDDYNRLNADAADTRNTANAPFAPIADTVGISFALAKIDPDGNCTNGVERRNSPGATYSAGENAKYDVSGGLDAWPRDRYFNIWIVNSIESDGSGGTTLGYAEFPQFDTDGFGIIIRHDSYGTTGTASGDRTLTHEVGHCLGLLHTFQGPFFGGGTGCHTTDCASAGDFICDTPPASASHWDCPAAYNSCTGIPANDYYGMDAYDQWENYMSYAPCQNMFSQDQVAMIQNNLVNIGFLADLVSLANQTATGVLAPEVLCQANFYADKEIICAGNSVSFMDESFFNVTGWNWTFEGAAISSSTDQNPIITYPNAGVFDVTLEVTDGISTVTLTLTDYIRVLPVPGDPLPYTEGFESISSLPDYDRFLVINENEADTWELTSSAFYTGSKSAYISNFGNDDGTADELISGTIDLSGVDPADPLVFSFQYAYKRRTSADDEWLKFYVSKDCGQTWALRKNLHGTSLDTDISASAFVPSSLDDWTEVVVTNITSDYYVADFRYKFEFINDNGNNIYLDHINMYPESMLGINATASSVDLSVYPNPTSNQTTLAIQSTNPSNCTIVLYDALGNEVQVVHDGILGSGTYEFEINTADLASGIYTIRFISDDQVQTIKLIKE